MNKIIFTLLMSISFFSGKAQINPNIRVFNWNDERIDINNIKNKSIDGIHIEGLISEIPKEILSLLDLKKISFEILNDSCADKIFSQLQNFKKLEKLQIDGNNYNANIIEPNTFNCLLKIPNKINNLKSLKTLMLSGHLISEFDIDVKKLVNIEKIYLFRNKIQEFPKNVLKLPKLKVLGLENNYIKVLPIDICKNSTIEELTIGRNSLKEIPLCILNMTSLKELFINENFITTEQINLLEYTLKEMNKKLYLITKDQQEVNENLKYDPSFDAIKLLIEKK